MLLNYFLKFLSLFSNYNSPFPFKIALWGGDETGYIYTYMYVCMVSSCRCWELGIWKELNRGNRQRLPAWDTSPVVN